MVCLEAGNAGIAQYVGLIAQLEIGSRLVMSLKWSKYSMKVVAANAAEELARVLEKQTTLDAAADTVAVH
jgi:uncharacterized membrane protein affecting hemolysin expression